MLRIAVLLLFFVVAASPAFGGAWTLPKWRSELRITSTFTYGDHGFDDDGKLIEVPEYRNFELRGTFEYGIRPWLTAILEGELREESIEREVLPDFFEPDPSSYGAFAGGARLRLYQAPSWVLSGQALGFTGGFASDGLRAPSDGPAVEGRVLAGYGTSFYGRDVFADIQAAYRYRFQKDDADEVKVDVTLGAHVRPRWLVLGQTFSTWETKGNTNYHKVSGSLVRKVNRNMRLSLSGIATVAGRNAVRELGGTIGFWYVY